MQHLSTPRPKWRSRSLATALALTLMVGASTTDGQAPSATARPRSLASSAAPVSSTALLRATGAPPSGIEATHRSSAKPRTDTTPAQRALALGAVWCADDPGALCGQFIAPLDRARRDGRTTPIDFRLILHTNPGSATSTVWWNGGGPGPSTTRNELWLPGYLFGDLLATYDVLLTDVRGTGSNAPECPSLQFFAGYWPGLANHQPIADCAASIADRINTYGAADSARDLDAIRAALGIPKLDIIGNSYGAMTATAYATRFPSRTRSLVISSGVDVEATLSSKITNEAKGIDRILDLLCSRSPACSAGIADASDALAAGVRILHAGPVEGDAISAADADVVRHVVLTEGMLFSMLEESDNGFLSGAGEIPAALIALGEGDSAPILRLAADANVMFTAAPFDVAAFVDSAGGYSASSCTDYRLPWKKGVALDARIDAAVESVKRLDARHLIGAWSAASIVRTPEYSDWHQLINCNRWPDVKAERAVADEVRYPRVPTLVMTSDLDPRTVFEDAQRQAARWPRAQLLNIGGAMHGAALWACGPSRVQAFLTTPGSPQAPCDPSEFPAFRAVGQFPVASADSMPLTVDPAGADSSTDADRQVAAVALNTALDANSVSARQPFLGKGAGLRGGYAVTSVDDIGFRIDLVDDRYAADVAVSGVMVFPFDGSSPSIDITFVTDGGSTGHLSVVGDWSMGRSASSPNVLPVTGDIDGRQVSLLLPL
jgi:pimeloyl-ACP methyl ester carboxylesterase